MNGAPAVGATLASRLALPAGSFAGSALALEPRAVDADTMPNRADSLASSASERADTLAPATLDSADTLASLTSSAPATPRRWTHVLVRSDLLHHASLSFTLAAGFTVLFRDHAAAAGLTLGLGVAKEVWDSRHRGADALDLLADVLGVGVALLTVPERGGQGP